MSGSDSDSDVQVSDAIANVSDNLGVEYVISFRFDGAEKQKVEAQFEKLIAALDGVGLRTEVRDGANGNVLVFVRVRSEQKLVGEVYRSRVKDWLHGVRSAAPDKETQRSLDKEPLTEAERLRIVWQLITLPDSEGGAGITPKQGQWDLVESVFPLHDHEFNKAWMKRWSTTWTIGPEELGKLRDRFGEKVAFYFAFLQSYLSFLVIAAAIGAGAFFLLPSYSLTFAITNCLWSVIFVEYWKRQEVDLAVRWGVRNVSSLQNRRAQFKHHKEIEDPITGEVVKFFPAWHRLARQALQIPFALGASGLLSALYACVFAIEIFLTEVYNGPFKTVLVFLPTVLLSVFVPVLTSVLTGIATKLTEFENYENQSGYEAAMTQKTFVFNFICSYVPLFLTAFVYVPFGNLIVPHLDVFNLTTPEITTESFLDDKPINAFQINPDRLKKQVIYFTVTAQIVNLALETIVPFAKRKIFRKVKKYQNARNGVAKKVSHDTPAEAAFLKRIRCESELEHYDVHTDLREMVMQFGYLTLFSPVWPLASVSFLINNWIELRSDAAKICVEMKRPVPHRADTIGPWLNNLGFLAWMGSISSAALIYLFADSTNGTPHSLTLYGVLASIIFSEHIYFATAYAVRLAMSKLESPGLQQERRERFLVRRRFLQESLGVDEESEINEKVAFGKRAEGTSTEEVMFWDRQKGPKMCVDVGKQIIRGALEKKDQ
ncbi:calcium-activated chloride channel-domain-containing protein [Morchella snyderi]|nr:calcium-activated chloride channel-domain-containing protein [Morchella snyderi]